MSVEEVKDKLEKIQHALNCLKDGSYKNLPSDYFESKVAKLEELKETYESKLNLLTEVKFAEDEVKVIAQEVGKAVGDAARGYGGEIDSAIAKDFDDQAFTVHITFKNDNEESYRFYIEDDTLHLLDRSYDREIADVGVDPSGAAVVNHDVVKNEMEKYYKSMNEMDNIRPKDAEFEKAKEADRLASHPEKETIMAIYALMNKEKQMAPTANEVEGYCPKCGKLASESGCNSNEGHCAEAAVNEDLNLHKIEVAVRDARRAQEIMYDQFDHQFEMNGSNVYLFDDEETAFDAMMTLGAHDIEVLNIEDFDEEMLDEMELQEMGRLKQVELQLKACPIGCIATGGGYGPWTKVKSNTWKNKRGMLSNSQSLASHIGGFDDFKLDESNCNELENINELFGSDFLELDRDKEDLMGVPMFKNREDREKDKKKDKKKKLKEITSTGKLTDHDDFKFLAKQLTDLCGPKKAKDCLKILLSVGELGLDLGYADAKGEAEMMKERVPDHKSDDVISKLDPDFIFALARAAHDKGYSDARDHLSSASDSLERELTVGLDESVAAISRELDKVKADIKTELEIFKTSESPENKKRAVEMLKKLNDKKKNLEKQLEAGVSNIGRGQELDADINEYQGFGDDLISMIKDKAADADSSDEEEVQEIIEFLQGLRFDDNGNVVGGMDENKPPKPSRIYDKNAKRSYEQIIGRIITDMVYLKEYLEKEGLLKNREVNYYFRKADGAIMDFDEVMAYGPGGNKSGRSVGQLEEKKSKTGKYGKHKVTVHMDGPVTTWKTTFPNGKSVAFADTIANIKFDDGTTGADYLAETKVCSSCNKNESQCHCDHNETANESIDKVTGGIPYRVEGGKAIISMPLPDDAKERIIKRCKEAGYHCAPNMAGGVTITLKKGTYEAEVNEGDEEAREAYYEIRDLIQKHSRRLNDDDSYTLHELLKDFFNRAI